MVIDSISGEEMYHKPTRLQAVAVAIKDDEAKLGDVGQP